MRLSRKMYSSKKEDTEGLSRLDKFNLRGYKNSKASRDLAHAANNEDIKGMAKYYRPINTIQGGLGGLAVGGIDSISGSVDKKRAVVGAALGAGLGALAAPINGYVVRSMKRRDSKFASRLNRNADLADVAEGKMSIEDYKKKWYKKD